LEEKSLKRIPWIAICAAILLVAGSVSPAAAAVLRGTKRQPVAIIQTSMGNLTCVLFPKSAPIGTENFIGLARGTKDWTDPRTGKTMHGVPLYDNTTFHRVIPQFMIQGGDPLGNGMGTPGFKFKNETWPDLKFDQPGRLAYANAGPDTNGSQFFITEVPTPFLDGKYTIFGQCDAASVRLVKTFARVPRNGADQPNTPVVIQHIEIDDGSHSHAATHHSRRRR
jgi:peptidyl-prolyl cis-trans isomerase A (cyclophilin A)